VKDSLADADDWHFTVSETTAQAMNMREELKILEKYNAIADLNYKMNQYNRIPDLLGIAEYGYQGEKYGFTVKSSFLMAGVVFRWNIFSGFQQNTRIQQAGIEKAMAEKQYTEAKSKIELEVMNAWYDLQASHKAIESSERQSEALKAAFEIIRRKYSEGQVNLVEFMDARTAMTNAEENVIVSRYDFRIKKAEMERVTNQYNTDFPTTKITDP
jgi:outer membrane protein TolC